MGNLKQSLTVAMVVLMVIGIAAPAAVGGALADNHTNNSNATNATEDSNATNATEDSNATNATEDSNATNATSNANATNASNVSEIDAFGLRVSAYVHSLLGNETEGPLGLMVAEFVVANNPGAEHRPDHAGPPDNIGPSAAGNGSAGPPDHAGSNASDGEHGPPEGVGSQSSGDHNETADDSSSSGGPPDHASRPR